MASVCRLDFPYHFWIEWVGISYSDRWYGYFGIYFLTTKGLEIDTTMFKTSRSLQSVAALVIAIFDFLYAYFW